MREKLDTSNIHGSTSPIGDNRNRCVVAIGEAERRDFLPGSLFGALETLFARVEWYQPDKGDEVAWADCLRRVNPEVILSGWSTPALPEGFYRDDESRLKYVCHLTGHFGEKISREDLEGGLVVSNWGNSISHSIAEHAIMLVLGALRKVNYFSIRMHQGKALGNVSVLGLRERRVGIHGFGQIARETARLLKEFRCELSVYSPQVSAETLAPLCAEKASSLEALFANNDVIIELEGYNERTRGTVTEALLRSMPPNGVFVNCGRAGIVDEAGLIAVATEGLLQVGLDVFHEEPLPEDSPLRGLENVILTPHVAGPTGELLSICGRHAVENIKRWVRDEPLVSPVSLAHFENMT